MRNLLVGFNMIMWTGAFVIGVVLVLWWNTYCNHFSSGKQNCCGWN
ncbi:MULTISPECIES: hypothetical protein [Bacillus cereus group]|nr:MULTISPECIES: hypothetical protein [Bacillus cereus group]QUG97973.1 hypothetical protein HCM98_24645 [Bacillus tropicus]